MTSYFPLFFTMHTSFASSLTRMVPKSNALVLPEKKTVKNSTYNSGNMLFKIQWESAERSITKTLDFFAKQFTANQAPRHR